MLFFFLSLIFAARETRNKEPNRHGVTDLNYKLYRQLILNRKDNQTWVVLFYDESNPTQRESKHEFIKTSSLSLDILNFATVDTKKNLQLAEDCGVFARNLPQVFVFSYKGKTEYVGNKRPDKMATGLLKFLPNLTQTANFQWKEDLLSNSTNKKAAILFAKNDTAPDFWNALAGYFQHDNIRIGYTNDKTLFDKFEIGEIPAVIFLNQSGQYAYQGKKSFKVLKEAIKSFIHNRFVLSETKKDLEVEPFYFSDEFETECFKHRSFCIVYASDIPNEDFEKMHDEYAGQSFKWFYSSDGWPFSFIKEDSIWIFDPRHNKTMSVQSMRALNVALRNINKQEVWRDISELLQQEEEL